MNEMADRLRERSSKIASFDGNCYVQFSLETLFNDGRLMGEAADEISRLRLLIEEKNEALTPFAKQAAHYDAGLVVGGKMESCRDEDEADATISVGDLRRARAAKETQ